MLTSITNGSTYCEPMLKS